MINKKTEIKTQMRMKVMMIRIVFLKKQLRNLKMLKNMLLSFRKRLKSYKQRLMLLLTRQKLQEKPLRN